MGVVLGDQWRPNLVLVLFDLVGCGVALWQDAVFVVFVGIDSQRLAGQIYVGQLQVGDFHEVIS